MKNLLEKIFNINTFAIALVLVSTFKFINSTSDLIKNVNNEVLTPCKNIFSDYEKRNNFIRNTCQILLMPSNN